MVNDASNKLFEELVETYKKYSNYTSADLSLISKAYELAQVIYFNEKRLSGIPFLNHCLNTALLCAYNELDATTISSAILHDSFSFGVTKADLEKEVNIEVAEMLESLEKIKTIRNRYSNININEESLYNDYLRRMILVFGSDIRVVLIRLFEKYDSLKDCQFLPKEKKKQVIKNMLDIYAPLADVMGLFGLKTQMENLAFEKQMPKTYLKYKKILKNQKTANQKAFIDFEKKLKKELALAQIEYIKVYGRVKGEYSFYLKVKNNEYKRHLSNKEAVGRVHDKTAYSLILKTEDDCYKAYSVIKHNFNLIDDETDDYIKVPKPNGYKSIHTVINLDGKTYIEVQIKTQEMHLHNEYGGASHAYYKLYGVSKVTDNKIEFLKKLINWKQDLSQGKKEFTQLEDTVLAITPKGDVIELPLESTALDFAYFVHTKIGESATRAIINNKMCKLNTVVNTGDIIQIITDKNVKKPKYEQLAFVKTKEARLYIKKRLKH